MNHHNSQNAFYGGNYTENKPQTITQQNDAA